MTEDPMNCRAIGIVRSPFKERGDAPCQGRRTDEISSIEISPEYQEGLDGLKTGDDLFVLCWFDRSDRSVLKTRRQGTEDGPLRGVFSTRSPARPNPISLTLVKLVEITGGTLRVRGLEALDNTPVLDIKPYSEGIDTPRETMGCDGKLL
ncbi:MAG: tRNA (N6-threonylcarbamoyladenosine(37)-N6)-methyltransferase TrmO [Methanocalculaceae archaeon]|jgi:tRNA-Thr(GGU) m(6)t(6)A37 methyltransferase TsaA|nr:tRNA (N6-threonylcarbamoyladenosine(37)-N6)-methyltransferase TrmO [Methanocalculaceae archaeon]